MGDADLDDMAVGGGDTLVTVASPISRRAAPAAPPTSIAHSSGRMRPAGGQATDRTAPWGRSEHRGGCRQAGRPLAAQRECAHIISLNR